MGKVGRNQKGERSDFSKEDKLAHENKKLKKELSQLRKQIKHYEQNFEHYERFKEYNKKQKLEEKIHASKQSRKASNKEKWLCHECESGQMKLMPPMPRRDGIFYYRKCTECDNRTRLKKWHKNVEES